MAPFRRPGLAEDDESVGRPDMIRPRLTTPYKSTIGSHKPHPNPGTIQGYHHLPTHATFGEDEESVISSLSAMSDLESLYVESSSKQRPRTQRDQYLLCQRLPGQPNNASPSSPAPKMDLLGTPNQERRGSSALMNAFRARSKDGGNGGDYNGLVDVDVDDDDDWETAVFAAAKNAHRNPLPASTTGKTSTSTSTSPTASTSTRPPTSRESAERVVDRVQTMEEQERIDLERAIQASILAKEEEDKRISELLLNPPTIGFLEDESKQTPKKPKRSSKKTNKKSSAEGGKKKSKKSKKPKEEGGKATVKQDKKYQQDPPPLSPSRKSKPQTAMRKSLPEVQPTGTGTANSSRSRLSMTTPAVAAQTKRGSLWSPRKNKISSNRRSSQ